MMGVTAVSPMNVAVPCTRPTVWRTWFTSGVTSVFAKFWSVPSRMRAATPMTTVKMSTAIRTRMVSEPATMMMTSRTSSRPKGSPPATAHHTIWSAGHQHALSPASPSAAFRQAGAARDDAAAQYFVASVKDGRLARRDGPLGLVEAHLGALLREADGSLVGGRAIADLHVALELVGGRHAGHPAERVRGQGAGQQLVLAADGNHVALRVDGGDEAPLAQGDAQAAPLADGEAGHASMAANDAPGAVHD